MFFFTEIKTRSREVEHRREEWRFNNLDLDLVDMVLTRAFVHNYEIANPNLRIRSKVPSIMQ